METPARHSFTLDGTTRVFPIPSNIKGDNYCRLEVDDVIINDRTKYDIVNNAIVFNNVADLPSGSQLDVLVVQSEEAIGQLAITTNIDIVSDNIADVNTVAAVSTKVTTVANNIANVNIVANNDANVTTVAGISGNVTTVAGISANVTTVANNDANITTVADDLNEPISEINTVAVDIANVNAVGINIANVNAVAANETNINSVQANEANINTVAGNNTNVTTVAGISTDVTTVAADGDAIGVVAGLSADVQTLADIEDGTVATAAISGAAAISTDIVNVAADAVDIGTVSTNITNVNTVAGISGNVTTTATLENQILTVAGISTDVTTVSGIASNVSIVGANASSVITTANGITDVNVVSSNISDINAVATNVTDVVTFATIYLGAFALAPTTSITGALYYNTTLTQLYIWNGSAWDAAAFSAAGLVASFNTRTGAVTLNSQDVTDALGFTPEDAAGVGTIAAQDSNNVTITGGSITGMSAPTVASEVATKEYVDTIASASLHYHDPVRVESPINLPALYDNGTAGVGATLTNNNGQTALSIDGVALNVNDRVLLYVQTDATQNGVYVVTDVGSGSTNWVLTRSADTNSYAQSSPIALGEGDAFYVQEGATGAGELYVMNTAGTITFGTTEIMFSQISSAQIYSAGNGLVLDGVEFSLNVTGTGTSGQYLASDGDGSMTWTTLSSDPTMGGDLSGTASNAQIVANSVGATELNVDGNGTAGQVLSSDGDGSMTWVSGGFPSGTRMAFQQTSAPTGWTKDTSAAINDAVLRLVTGTTGSGGSTAFSTFNASTATGATTLSTAQMPSHAHSLPMKVNATKGGGVGGVDYNSYSGSITYPIATASAGGNGSHTHSLATNIKYYDFIIASKD